MSASIRLRFGKRQKHGAGAQSVYVARNPFAAIPEVSYCILIKEVSTCVASRSKPVIYVSLDFIQWQRTEPTHGRNPLPQLLLFGQC